MLMKKIYMDIRKPAPAPGRIKRKQKAGLYRQTSVIQIICVIKKEMKRMSQQDDIWKQAMGEFKRAERITMLAAALATLPVLVLTLVNGQNYGGDFVTRYSFWVWNAVIIHIAPTTYWFSGGPAPALFLLVLGVTFLVFLPMCLIRRTRYAGAVCMMVCSYIFAAILWVYSLGVLYPSILLIVIGAVLAYIGVIPFALIALMIVQDWGFVIPMLVLAACFTAARVFMNVALKGKSKELYSCG